MVSTACHIFHQMSHSLYQTNLSNQLHKTCTACTLISSRQIVFFSLCSCYDAPLFQRASALAPLPTNSLRPGPPYLCSHGFATDTPCRPTTLKRRRRSRVLNTSLWSRPGAPLHTRRPPTTPDRAGLLRLPACPVIQRDKARGPVPYAGGGQRRAD
jgi:hypothetical protein